MKTFLSFTADFQSLLEITERSESVLVLNHDLPSAIISLLKIIVIFNFIAMFLDGENTKP